MVYVGLCAGLLMKSDWNEVSGSSSQILDGKTQIDQYELRLYELDTYEEQYF